MTGVIADTYNKVALCGRAAPPVTGPLPRRNRWCQAVLLGSQQLINRNLANDQHSQEEPDGKDRTRSSRTTRSRDQTRRGGGSEGQQRVKEGRRLHPGVPRWGP